MWGKRRSRLLPINKMEMSRRTFIRAFRFFDSKKFGTWKSESERDGCWAVSANTRLHQLNSVSSNFKSDIAPPKFPASGCNLRHQRFNFNLPCLHIISQKEKDFKPFLLINIKLFVNFTFFRPFPCTYLSFILLFYFFLSFSIFFCLFFSSLRKYFSIFYILFSVKSSTCFSLNIPFIFYQKFRLYFVKYSFYFPSHILFRKLFNKSDRFCHFLPNLKDQTCPFPKKQHEFTGKQNGKT